LERREAKNPRLSKRVQKRKLSRGRRRSERDSEGELQIIFSEREGREGNRSVVRTSGVEAKKPKKRGVEEKMGVNVGKTSESSMAIARQ